jgi:hypothetical protein
VLYLFSLLCLRRPIREFLRKTSDIKQLQIFIFWHGLWVRNLEVQAGSSAFFLMRLQPGGGWDWGHFKGIFTLSSLTWNDVAG